MSSRILGVLLSPLSVWFIEKEKEQKSWCDFLSHPLQFKDDVFNIDGFIYLSLPKFSRQHTIMQRNRSVQNCCCLEIHCQ